MSRYSGVTVHSYAVVGSDGPTQLVEYSDHRQYVMIYAKQGTCYITIGPYNINNEIAITEGNTYEPIVMPRNEIWYRGPASSLVLTIDSLGTHPEDFRIQYNGFDVLAPGSEEQYLHNLI